MSAYLDSLNVAEYLAAAPVSAQVELICESAKVSGTLPRQVAYPQPMESMQLHQDAFLPVWRDEYVLCESEHALVDCPPTSVFEHCLMLLSFSAFRAREVMKAPGVDQIATNICVGRAGPRPQSLGDSYPDLFVSEFVTY